MRKAVLIIKAMCIVAAGLSVATIAVFLNMAAWLWVGVGKILPRRR